MVPIYGSHYISVVRCCYRIQIRTIPPKGWGGWRLSTRVRASSVEWCSQDSISTCPIYPSELQQPKKTLRVAGTCHWKPSASSRASRVEGVSTGPTAPDTLPCSHLKTHVSCPSAPTSPRQTEQHNFYVSFSENMLPVPPASELPSLNIYQLAIVLFIGCWLKLSIIHTSLLAFLHLGPLWDSGNFIEFLSWN